MPLAFARVKKPPYRIPSMDEIAAVPKNGLKFVSTFSGCGGSCLGFEMAGWTPLMASEFVPAAQEVYELNHPGVPIAVGDVRDLEPALILEYLGLEVGELDCLEGSPPCSDFSTAGKRSAGWGKTKKYSDTEQRVDDLFFEFVRLVDGLKPKTFVAENVTGLMKGVAVGYFRTIARALEDVGYVVTPQKLDASWLGVPQARQRVLFIGVRKDLGLEPPDVKTLKYRDYQYTVRDAIPLAVRHGTAPPHRDWAPGVGNALHRNVEATMVDSGTEPCPTIVAAGENKGVGWVEARVPTRVVHEGPSWASGDVTDRPCPTITVGVDSLNSHHYQVEEETVMVRAMSVGEVDAPDDGIGVMGHPFAGDLDGTVAGRIWEEVGEQGGHTRESYFNLVRASADEPSPTVAAAGGTRGTVGISHPVERRKFTIPELKRICAFPDDFVLTGNYRQQWERLGRAVPPRMMEAVAESVRDLLLA